MELTHFDNNGNARMVDISNKNITKRTAIATGCIRVSKETLGAIIDKKITKGDVFSVATTAGIMAIKKNFELIPMCHIILIDNATITWEINDKADLDDKCEIKCFAKVSCESKTGAEMEALSGASIALLTVYDMVKAVDKDMVITDIMLLEKTGGKSGDIKKNI